MIEKEMKRIRSINCIKVKVIDINSDIYRCNNYF